MRQLLDLASENTALKRELAQVRGEATELKHYLVEIRQICATRPCSPGEDPTIRCMRTQIDAVLAEARDLNFP